MGDKKGQLQISFSMIFSIILIVAFISVAIYGIMVFLDIKKCADTGIYKTDLQEEVDRAWNGEESSMIFSRNLPSKIDSVCFIDMQAGERGGNDEEYAKMQKMGLVKTNIFFWPIKNACEGEGTFELNHINISKITSQENPYCVEKQDGKIEINIEKGFYDPLVTLK